MKNEKLNKIEQQQYYGLYTENIPRTYGTVIVYQYRKTRNNIDTKYGLMHTRQPAVARRLSITWTKQQQKNTTYRNLHNVRVTKA